MFYERASILRQVHLSAKLSESVMDMLSRVFCRTADDENRLGRTHAPFCSSIPSQIVGPSFPPTVTDTLGQIFVLAKPIHFFIFVTHSSMELDIEGMLHYYESEL